MKGMARESTEIARIEQRIRDLASWLKENGPEGGLEQKHLQEGSPERVYWHLGYMVALRDTLSLLRGQDSTTRRDGTTDSSSMYSAF